MNLKNTSNRYASLSIAMHWLMLLLIAAVYACIELRELYPRGSDPRDALKMWHFMLGLSVLALVVLRLGIRLVSGPTPGIEPPPAKIQIWMAKAAHIALYVLMLGMPIAGWLILSLEGKTIPFWGFELPPLMAVNDDLAEWIEEIHETAGLVGYYLIGLHAAAALFHHYVLKDNTLRRMLPGKARGKQK